MTVPPPPAIETLTAGSTLVAGNGHAAVLPTMDFETYCEAGFVWSDELNKWGRPPGASTAKKGLGLVGAARYSEHPTCEVLSLAYDLKDGLGRRWWRPGLPLPADLFAHIAAGGLVESHNSGFEGWIWRNVCVPRYGFPPLPRRQQRCSMAKARAHALPGALDDLSNVLALTHRKNPDGKRLLDKFSIPRNPTKTDPRRRIRPEDDPADAVRLYTYNMDDVSAEGEASSRIPDLSPDELELWLIDQEINTRGVAVDSHAIDACAAIIEQAYERYNAELHTLTGGAVEKASQLERLKGWLAGHGVYMAVMDDDAITAMLKQPNVPAPARRALEIRQLVGSASVKKLYAMRNQTTRAGRIHDLFLYHAARPGRWTGAEAQPQNLPKAGPKLFGPNPDKKPPAPGCCGRYFGAHTHICPWCGAVWPPTSEPQEWNAHAIDDALEIILTASLECVQMFYGDAVKLVSGVIRGLLIAATGADLISSDFSAIEAVVLACLAGEDWRIQVFKTHGLIYETSAARVTGMSLDDFARYYAEHGKKHPMRQSVGKCLELACGYGGWVNGAKAPNIAMDRFFTDDEIKGHILAWRAASPAVVEFWGGQERNKFDRGGAYRRELFGLEGMAISAVLNPGQEFTFHAPHPDARPITYFMRGDALYCRLPSGRLLTYHQPRLDLSTRPYQEGNLTLSYMGWNTNPVTGPVGWIRIETYSGKLTENVVQAVARDILAYAIVQLNRAGYWVVMHVHDEIVSEIAQGWGSIEEFERIMSTLAPFATGWPVAAKGGWRGKRYRKE